MGHKENILRIGEHLNNQEYLVSDNKKFYFIVNSGALEIYTGYTTPK
jgi:hypothetical protein